MSRTEQAKQGREGYEQNKAEQGMNKASGEGQSRSEQASKDDGIREQKKSSNNNGASYLTADNRSL